MNDEINFCMLLKKKKIIIIIWLSRHAIPRRYVDLDLYEKFRVKYWDPVHNSNII